MKKILSSFIFTAGLIGCSEPFFANSDPLLDCYSDPFSKKPTLICKPSSNHFLKRAYAFSLFSEKPLSDQELFRLLNVLDSDLLCSAFTYVKLKKDKTEKEQRIVKLSDSHACSH